MTTDETSRHWRPWLLLGIMSVASFWLNAGVFTTLGVVLPFMVKEMGWGWTQAGLGFTILGASVGLSSYFPRALIRRHGVRAALLVGTIVMATGFACLGQAHGIALFYLGTMLCGAGYQMMSIIPSTYVIGAVFARPAKPIGIYFTVFALGSVFGPFIALGILDATGDAWRNVWRFHALDMILWGGICTLMIGSSARLAADQARVRSVDATGDTQKAWQTSTDWTLREALRTPQFWLLGAAYMTHMLVAISVSSLSIPHLGQRGIPAATAAAMLSLEQLVQTFARGLGGMLGDRLDPLYILMIGLLCLAIGPATLAFASDTPTMLVYAIATGLGYGLTVVAAVLLLMNYFGRAHNLEIFTCISFSGAVSAFGPAIGGALRDATGNFQTGFIVFAGVNLVILGGALAMRPPMKRQNSAA